MLCTNYRRCSLPEDHEGDCYHDARLGARGAKGPIGGPLPPCPVCGATYAPVDGGCAHRGPMGIGPGPIGPPGERQAA